jgi:hypothetical protein
MWRRVDLVWTDVSEKYIASIFRVEKSASEEPAWAGSCRKWTESRIWFLVRITLKMEAIFFRNVVELYSATMPYIPDDRKVFIEIAVRTSNQIWKIILIFCLNMLHISFILLSRLLIYPKGNESLTPSFPTFYFLHIFILLFPSPILFISLSLVSVSCFPVLSNSVWKSNSANTKMADSQLHAEVYECHYETTDKWGLFISAPIIPQYVCTYCQKIPI